MTIKDTQVKQIYDYMMTKGSITQKDALKPGIYRLASRICDLRQQGVPIITTRETVVKANGEKTNIARYAVVKREA